MQPRIRTLSIGRAVEATYATIGRSAIEKRPVRGPVVARALGLDGDEVGDPRHHGGLDQAVYAYAREDLDWWETELGGPLADGGFGENLTTEGIDVNAAEVGERWQVGGALLVPCVESPCALRALIARTSRRCPRSLDERVRRRSGALRRTHAEHANRSTTSNAGH